MKITKGQLKQIIKEELSSVLTESWLPGGTSDSNVASSSDLSWDPSWNPQGSNNPYDLSDLGGQYGGQFGGWAGEQAGPYFAEDWVPDDLASYYGRQKGTQVGTQLGTQAGQWGEDIFGGGLMNTGPMHLPTPTAPAVPDVVQQGVDVAGDVFGQGVDAAQDVLSGWFN